MVSRKRRIIISSLLAYTLFSSVLLLCSAQYHTGSISQDQVHYHHDGQIRRQDGTFLNALSNKINSPRKAVFESPQCWMGSYHAILHDLSSQMHSLVNNNDMNIAGERVCSVMKDEHQTRLALELTRCFLIKSGRGDHFSNSDHCSSSSDSAFSTACLRSLSDAEFHIYTEFYNQIYSICRQLSQESWNAQLLDSTKLLQESSRLFSDGLKDVVEDHFEQINHMNKKVESSFVEMDRIFKVFEGLNDTFTTIHQKVGDDPPPIMKTLLFLFVHLNAIHLFTGCFFSSKSRFRSIRSKLFSLAILGFILDLSIHFAIEKGIFPTIICDLYGFSSQCTGISFYIQKQTLFCEAIVGFSSIVVIAIYSPFASTTNDDSNEDKKYATTRDVQKLHAELLQRVDSSLSQNRNEMCERDERLIRIFQRSIRETNNIIDTIEGLESDRLRHRRLSQHGVYSDRYRSSVDHSYPSFFQSPAFPPPFQVDRQQFSGNHVTPGTNTNFNGNYDMHLTPSEVSSRLTENENELPRLAAREESVERLFEDDEEDISCTLDSSSNYTCSSTVSDSTTVVDKVHSNTDKRVNKKRKSEELNIAPSIIECSSADKRRKKGSMILRNIKQKPV